MNYSYTWHILIRHVLIWSGSRKKHIFSRFLGGVDQSHTFWVKFFQYIVGFGGRENFGQLGVHALWPLLTLLFLSLFFGRRPAFFFENWNNTDTAFSLQKHKFTCNIISIGYRKNSIEDAIKHVLEISREDALKKVNKKKN